MLRFVKGTLRRLSAYRNAQAPKRIAGLRCWDIWLAGSLQGKNQANQFLSGVRDSDIVMLALSSLLGKIGGEGRFPNTNVFGSVEKGVSQVA